MKYNVFLRTKTQGGTGKWVVRPDYIPANIHEICESIISLCENTAFSGLSRGEWDQNFFYLRRGGYCLLARVAKCGGTASLEGISVKSEDERHLFYNIPSLLNELLPPAKSFYAAYEQGGEMSDVFEAVPLLNPFDGFKFPPEVHPSVINNPAYRNLLKFVAFTARPTGFVFGSHARAFAPLIDREGLRIEHVFDFGNPDAPDIDQYSFAENYRPITCEYFEPTPTGKDKVAIKLLIQEAGKDSYKYRWEVKPWEESLKDSKRARYVTKFYEIDDRIELSKLELQKESIQKFLKNNGWVKQGVGLRFEKDLFQREGFN